MVNVPPNVEQDPRWELVRRVLSSPSFARSARLQAFLRYVCALALDGREEEIVEQQIGVEVFAKSPNYNPGDDNTVRVQARLLRQKLAEYFAQEGSAEPIVIDVPKGGYVPLFLPRSEKNGFASPQPEPGEHRAIWAMAVLVCLLGGLSIWLWTQNLALQQAAPAPVAHAPILTGLVVQPSQQNYLVVADSGLVMAQVLTDSNITLDQYSGPWYRTTMARAGSVGATALGLLLTPRYTSMADLTAYGKLLQAHPQAWGKLQVRHARAMQTRDFKEGNFVLLGSPRSNPWGDLFSPQLSFTFGVKMPSGLSFIRNKSPRAGEQAEYVSDPTPNSAGVAYAHIAFLRNLAHTGRVLMLSGTTSPGTEAAVEFATDPAAYRQVSKLLGGVALHHVRQFEILLRVVTVEDTANEWSVIASRVTL
jgi:hypothetical protein